MFLPTFNEFVNEGALTNYRTEKEGMRLTEKDLSGSFDEVIVRLINERIPLTASIKAIQRLVILCTNQLTL